MEDYTGIVSELTAITKYEYQSVVLMNTFSALCQRLFQDWHGRDASSPYFSAAHLCGGDPRYRAHSNPTMGHFWSGQNVDYQFELGFTDL